MGNRPGMKVGEREHSVQGDMLKIGQQAPDFRLTANDWKKKSLADYAGKVKILSVIPSIDTRVCSLQTRRFNEEAAKLSQDIAVLTISADLPYALRRYCGNEGIQNTETLSTHYDMKFADDYGVHDTELRICQRACFVIDQHNVIQHAEYVYVMSDEVDYIAALSSAQKLASPR